MNLPYHANDFAVLLGNVSNASNPLLLLAFAATFICAMVIRGQLSPDIIAEFNLPFSRATLTAVGFVALFAWAISGL